MEDKLNNEELRVENELLKSKLEAIERSERVKKKAVFWFGKKIFWVFIGSGLKNAIKRGIDEFNTTKKISSESLSEISAHLIWRLTRIGAFGILIALLPSGLLTIQTCYLRLQNEKIDNQNELISNQNLLVKHQNNRLDQQTYLQEADRRSSLVFLFANIMDAIDKELKNIKEGNERDLSRQLIGRIVSLSRSLKPYKYLSNDTLTPLLSPERSQLLVNLINAELGDSTYEDIFSEGDFSYLELKDFTFRYIPFGYVDFDYSNFDNVNFMNCSFSGNGFKGVVSDHVKFEYCDFNSLTIKDAYFESLSFFTCIFNEGLIFDTSYAKNLRFEDTCSRAIDFSNSFLESLLSLNSYTIYFDYAFDEKRAIDYFKKTMPEKYNIFSGNRKKLTLETNPNNIGFVNTYFEHLSSDEAMFAKLRKNSTFKFHKYYLEKLNQKDILCNYLDLNEYSLKYEKVYKKCHVLIDTVMTPMKILQIVKHNALGNASHNYLSSERMIENAQKIFDGRVENLKTNTIEYSDPDDTVVNELSQ